MTDWIFPDAPETPVLTVRSILDGQPVQCVEHDEHGGWHFLDGRSVFNGSELSLVPLRQLVERDPSLREMADLPMGWRAFRDAACCPWERESRATRDRTRARTAAALARMAATTTTLPPGSPTTTELLREDRER